MTPRVSKKERGDLPKPVVQTGSLGFYPLGNLTLSYLYNDHTDIVIGLKDDPNTLSVKEKQQVSVRANKRATKYSVKGKFFNGLSDSFYRGKMPNVVVCVMDVTYLDHFIEEFLDHVEKMLSLGFFLQKPNPVEELIPCFVIASNGMFFNNLINKLSATLTRINALDELQCKQILGKFTRGIMDTYDQQEFVSGSTVEIEQPRLMKIAGGYSQTQMTIQSVLSAHGLITSIETSVENPVERLELTNAYKRIMFSVLPYLAENGKIKKKDLKPLGKEVQEAVFDVGIRRKSFEETETLKSALTFGDKPADAPAIITGDVSVLSALASMADHYNMKSASELFGTLKEQVKSLA